MVKSSLSSTSSYYSGICLEKVTNAINKSKIIRVPAEIRSKYKSEVLQTEPTCSVSSVFLLLKHMPRHMAMYSTWTQVHTLALCSELLSYMSPAAFRFCEQWPPADSDWISWSINMSNIDCSSSVAFSWSDMSNCHAEIKPAYCNKQDLV